MNFYIFYVTIALRFKIKINKKIQAEINDCGFKTLEGGRKMKSAKWLSVTTAVA